MLSDISTSFYQPQPVCCYCPDDQAPYHCIAPPIIESPKKPLMLAKIAAKSLDMSGGIIVGAGGLPAGGWVAATVGAEGEAADGL